MSRPGHLRSSRRTAGTGRLRLFCFPHAGAGGSCFVRWQGVLGDVAEIVPVPLPGRGGRAREPRITTPERLLPLLLERLGPLLDRPFMLYGHSLGGHVAHAFAQAVAASGLALPERVVLGAVLPPHRPSPLLPPSPAPPSDEELLGRLVAHGMLPPAALEASAGGIWRRSTLPALRDDLRLSEALRTRGTGPLTAPVLAVAGSRDTVAPAAWVAEWRRYAPTGFALRTVPGGHLFLRERQVPELLRGEIQRLTGGFRCGSSTN
ncbi:thioesterase II family protein [Streptomyces fuscichromogenes]|uniref:Thioesterase n=1 Tax=Streptomyces fuscichromogenes TaxID=1324013 RepID=A0A917XK39_9ACTN|nr:alpha/beta fold hydrolase [Streptomyces fuscichromogenes]GGN33519.1 thioesterase [Streptomyces fuscichromogenes]